MKRIYVYALLAVSLSAVAKLDFGPPKCSSYCRDEICPNLLPEGAFTLSKYYPNVKKNGNPTCSCDLKGFPDKQSHAIEIDLKKKQCKLGPLDLEAKEKAKKERDM